MMDACELICVLSMVMKIPSPRPTIWYACSYCTSVDGLTDGCNKDPVDCWYTSSKDLLYCLTTFEFRSTVALRTRRCIEHATFPLDLKVLKQMSAHVDECSFRTAALCNCSTCITPTATRPPTVELKQLFDQVDPDLEVTPAVRLGADDYEADAEVGFTPPHQNEGNWFLHDKSSYKANEDGSLVGRS
ncbi:hypothetical protein M3Y99_00869600 [Aphelenchoides fujianensis]|nr:hypothetical protein M3Y99_00869600 [Aphelenchoides fujianensis]